MRKLITILLLMVSAAGAMAQNTANTYDPNVRIYFQTGTERMEDQDYEKSEQYCSSFAQKHNIQIVFFIASDESLTTDNLVNQLDYICDNFDWYGNHSYRDGLFVMINKDADSYSYRYENEIMGNIMNTYEDVFSKLVNTWATKSVINKFLEMLDCILEGKPLLPFGTDWDKSLEEYSYNDYALDISGLLVQSECNEIREKALTIKKTTSRTIRVAIVYAPTFNERTLRFFASKISQKYAGDTNLSVVMINEYNNSFAIIDDNPGHKLPEPCEKELKDILDRNYDEFLTGSTICSFIDKYAEYTSTSNERLSHIVDDIGPVICCSAFGAIPLGLIIARLIIIAKGNKRRQKPNNPSRYIVEGSYKNEEDNNKPKNKGY